MSPGSKLAASGAAPVVRLDGINLRYGKTVALASVMPSSATVLP